MILPVTRRMAAWTLAGVMLAFAGRGAAAEADGVELRFAAQAVPRGLGKVAMVAGEARSEPFELPVNFLSPAAPAPARAFHLEREGKPGSLGTVRLPEEGDAFIVLLVPGLESPFEAVVIRDRGEGFRPGDYYVHNTSKKMVLGKVGNSSFVVPARQGRVVRPGGAREGRFYEVALGVREGSENRMISVFDVKLAKWPALSNRRWNLVRLRMAFPSGDGTGLENGMT